MIHIKGNFEAVEAKLLRAKDTKDNKAVICDRNNYNFINFKGKAVKCEGEDDLSIYLHNKAIEKGGAKGQIIKPKPAKIKAK